MSDLEVEAGIKRPWPTITYLIQLSPANFSICHHHPLTLEVALNPTRLRDSRTWKEYDESGCTHLGSM